MAPCVGDVVPTVLLHDARPGSGYLAVACGEAVKILHVGASDVAEESCWIYARRVEMPTDEGWLPMSTIDAAPAQILQSAVAAAAAAGGNSASVLKPGDLVTVRQVCDADSGSCHLSVALGDALKVLHVGSDGDEMGWVYACHEWAPESAGWLMEVCIERRPAPVELLSGHSAELTASHAEHQIDPRVGEVMSVTKACEAKSGSGYLSVAPGEGVELRYPVVRDDSGSWIFVRRIQQPCDEGWLPLAVACSQAISVAPNRSTLAQSRTAPGPPPPPFTPRPGDTVYHLRPGGFATHLRAWPFRDAQMMCYTCIRNNERLEVVKVENLWAEVKTEYHLTGWLRVDYLRPSPLRPQMLPITDGERSLP
eukprot:gnl/TRDRNA2_/TRDRNA2_200283_c0_seq1.p1 gnl/TRDRNA2_/TRDRNA2_200283_c0~~gnl/TRDRNA2_/TRDRNA2_200283_c0_seq1.p1  ORF type:complete len:366 (-),score=52.43 gnl/TRDRNA2_/TRDRNA2_200283_c0_seq1:40-1137(-)